MMCVSTLFGTGCTSSNGSVEKSFVLLYAAARSGTALAIKRCHSTKMLSVKESCCEGIAWGSSSVPPPEGATDIGGRPPFGQRQPLECMRESSLLCLLLCGLSSAPTGWVIFLQTHRNTQPL